MARPKANPPRIRRVRYLQCQNAGVETGVLWLPRATDEHRAAGGCGERRLRTLTLLNKVILSDLEPLLKA